MHYLIETYGCQMNKAESAALENLLFEHGFAKTEQVEESNLVIINTCSVRISAENRAWGRIAHYAALKRSCKFTLLVCGCMAERLKEDMKKKVPGIDYVLGTFQKSAFSTLLAAIKENRIPEVLEETPAYVFAPSHLEAGSFSSYVPIMHGCNNFCSYCIVPYVRGRELSRSPESILKEIKAQSEMGIKEITLLGQNVNSYLWKENGTSYNFAWLLKLLAESGEARLVERIRFLSSHPKDLSEETIDVLAAFPVFARHIHLCVQHGSDRILELMNRRYTSAQYIDLAEKIIKRIPGTSLSTDILVGFPGETEEDLEATLELMKKLRFAYAYMYYYNPREGTLAAKMANQIDTATKKSRLARVIALQKEISKSVMETMLGTEANVLIEGPSKRRKDEMIGRTDQDMMAVFRAEPSLTGTFKRIRLLALNGNTFKAELVS